MMSILLLYSTCGYFLFCYQKKNFHGINRRYQVGLVQECDPVIFCLKFGNYLQFTFEMIKDKKAWQINLGLGLKLGLELRVRVKVRI